MILNEKYQSLVSEFRLDEADVIGIELNFQCEMPMIGFRIVLTDYEFVSVFHEKFYSIERPFIFQVDDLMSGANLSSLMEVYALTAMDSELLTITELKMENEPTVFFQHVYHTLLSAKDTLHNISVTDLMVIITKYLMLVVNTSIFKDDPATKMRVVYKERS